MPSPSREDHFNARKFLDSLSKRPVIDFYGVKIPTPNDPPLSYTLKKHSLDHLSAGKTEDLVETLVELLGQDIMDEVIEVDPSVRDLSILVLWAYFNMNGGGNEMTFSEAADLYFKQQTETVPGKAPAKPAAKRAPRKAASGPKSASTSR